MNKKMLGAVLGTLSFGAMTLAARADEKPPKAEKKPKGKKGAEGDAKGGDKGEKSCKGDKGCHAK